MAKQRHDVGVQKKLRRQARQTLEARRPAGNLDYLAAKLVRQGRASPLVLGYALPPKDRK